MAMGGVEKGVVPSMLGGPMRTFGNSTTPIPFPDRSRSRPGFDHREHAEDRRVGPLDVEPGRLNEGQRFLGPPAA